MKFLESAPEMDLTDIDISNVGENISNAGKIFDAIVEKVGEHIAEVGINLILSLLLLCYATGDFG